MKNYGPDTRRHFLKGLGALLAHTAFASPPDTGAAPTVRNNKVQYGQDTLGVGIRSRYVDNNNGVTMHDIGGRIRGAGSPLRRLAAWFPGIGLYVERTNCSRWQRRAIT